MVARRGNPLAAEHWTDPTRERADVFGVCREAVPTAYREEEEAKHLKILPGRLQKPLARPRWQSTAPGFHHAARAGSDRRDTWLVAPITFAGQDRPQRRLHVCASTRRDQDCESRTGCEGGGKTYEPGAVRLLAR